MSKFIIGFEFEFFHPLWSDEIEDDLHRIFGRKLGSKFEVIEDCSLKTSPETRNLKGWEIVTPPLPEKESMEVFSVVRDYLVETEAKTNKTTGLHVNMSIQNKKVMKAMDPRIVIASTDDLYLAKIYGRVKNSYCEPWPSVIRKLDKERKKENKKSKSYYTFDLKTEFDNIVYAMYVDSMPQPANPVVEEFFCVVDGPKYTSINIGKLEYCKYIEYRMIGGPSYLEEPNYIYDAVEHFKLGQEKATDKRNEKIIPEYLEWASEVKL